MNAEELVVPSEVKPLEDNVTVEEPSANFSVGDYFKKNVTLPSTTIVLYTDGATAWEYTELSDKQNSILLEQGTLSKRIDAMGNTRESGSIADEDPAAPHQQAILELDEKYNALAEQKRELLKKLNQSGVEVELRALYPAENQMSVERGRRITVVGDKNEEEKALAIAQTTNALYFAVSVKHMKYPDGSVVTEFDYKDFLALEDYLDSVEYNKLIVALSQLNTRAAIRDAQKDAGFPGRRAQ